MTDAEDAQPQDDATSGGSPAASESQPKKPAKAKKKAAKPAKKSAPADKKPAKAKKPARPKKPAKAKKESAPAQEPSDASAAKSARGRVGGWLAAFGGIFVAAWRWLRDRVRGDSLRAKQSAARTGATAAGKAAPKDESFEPLVPRLKRHLSADPGPRAPWYRRAVTFVSAGILAAAGIGLLVVWIMRPDPVELDARRVIEARPTPAVAPSPAPTLTDFSADLPTASLDYGLVRAGELPWRGRVAWPERNAEAWILEYASQTDSVYVVAVQHFTVEEATAAWEQLRDTNFVVPLGVVDDARPDAGEAFMRVDQEAADAGTQVARINALVAWLPEPEPEPEAEAEDGEAASADPSPSPSADAAPYVPQAVVMWRNETAVFALVGDASDVMGLYLEYDR